MQIFNPETLKNKTVFISGATGGIGSACAKAFSNVGCNLFLTSTSEKELSKISKGLEKPNSPVRYAVADLTKPREVRRVIEVALADNQVVDILINCAGVFPYLDIADSTDDDFDDIMSINLKAAFMFTRELSVGMVQRRWGRIINVGSSSAYNGSAGTSLYCASKHALLGFSKSTHEELKAFNVRTYFVSPSSTQSKMGLATKGQDYSTFLDPEDVAKYIIFAVSFEGNIMAEEIFLKRMMLR